MIVFITGTSRGLGRFLKQRLVQRGHTVVGCSRAPAQGSDDLRLDVTDASACEDALRWIKQRHGRIDAVVNNAGYHLVGAALETTPEELRAQMELNFFGSVNVLRAAVPLMIEQRAGRLVNVGSIGGVLASPFAAAYNASKFALEGYAAALRAECAPFGVHVSNLRPAFVRTGTHGRSLVATRGEHALFSPHRMKVLRHMEAGGEKGVPMEAVARALERTLSARQPRFHDSVDGLAARLALLRVLMPQRMFEAIVVRNTAPGWPEAATRSLPNPSNRSGTLTLQPPRREPDGTPLRPAPQAGMRRRGHPH